MPRRSRSEADLIRRLSEELRQTEDPFTFARLADLLLDHGRVLEARSTCEQCIARYPDYTTIRAIMARVCEAQGDMERAEAELRTVIVAEPHNRTCRVALGRLLLQRGALGEAREHLEHALFLAPGDATARGLLAQASGQTVQRPPPRRQEPGEPVRRAVELLAETDGVEAVFLINGNGLPIASSGKQGTSEEQLTAIAHETWQLAARYVVRMQLGALRHATVLGSGVTFILAPSPPGLLAVAVRPAARLGLITMQIEAARNLLAGV